MLGHFEEGMLKSFLQLMFKLLYELLSAELVWKEGHLLKS